MREKRVAMPPSDRKKPASLANLLSRKRLAKRGLGTGPEGPPTRQFPKTERPLNIVERYI